MYVARAGSLLRQKSMNKNKHNQFIVLLVLTLVLLAGLFLVSNPALYKSQAEKKQDVYTKIRGDEDLDSASQSLDSVDFSSVDKTVDQNQADSVSN